jgi:hypothetical protein
MSDVDVADVTGPEDSGVGGLGVQPPDPAQVAALPPRVRQLCTDFAGKFDTCWNTMIGGATGVDDPSIAATMDSTRVEMLRAVTDACLQAAVSSPEVFEPTFGLFRPCFAVPCEQFQDCLMNAASNPTAPTP